MKFKNSLVGKIATGVLALGIGLSNYGCSGGSSTPTPTPNPTYKTCYLDADHDGQGDENSSLDVLKTEACPANYVENKDDPNDLDWTCYKGAGEGVFSKVVSTKDQLFTYNLETKTESRLTDNTFDDRYARLSPDAKEVIFTRVGDGTDKIMKKNRETNIETQLTNKTKPCRYSSYSPDGTQFTYSFHNGTDWDIYIANSSDGSSDTLLVEGVLEDVLSFWGSDNKIYFQSNRDGNEEIYRINPDKTGLERITQTIDGDDKDENTIPVLSPDKNYISDGIGQIGQEDIYLINLQNYSGTPLGESARSPPLTIDHKNYFYTSWSKDSKRLVFDSYDSGKSRVYMIDIDGSNKSDIFNDEENRWGFDWAKN